MIGSALSLTHMASAWASPWALPTSGYFITPALMWAGIGLASLPIIIHLLSRRRVRHVEWAAMTWLMAAMKRHQRRLRMENWLILLMRIAAIVLLGLALARPVLQDSPLAGLVASKRSVYLVLDNSYSVEAKQEARSVLERVKHEADLVLRSIGPDDATAVVVTNDPEVDVSDGLDPHVLLGRSVGSEGAARVREAVAALRARDAVADWARTIDKVQEQMSDQDVNRNVVIVTDLQAKDWLSPPRERIGSEDASGSNPGRNSQSDSGRLRKKLMTLLRRPAKVRIIDVGGTDRRDLAILGVENRTGQEPFVGRPLQLAVTVANYGEQPVSGAMLEVRINDGAQRRTVPVPELAGADAGLRVPKPAIETVQVDLGRNTFDRPGSHSLQLTVIPPRDDPSADALGLSSNRWLALEVRDRIRVLAWPQTSRSERDMDAELYLRAIYEGIVPGDSGSSTGAGIDGVLPPIYSYASANTGSEFLARLEGEERIDLVVIANVVPRDERVLRALREYVSAGGGLLVFTGDQSSPDAFNASFFTEGSEVGLLPFQMAPAQVRERGNQNDPDPTKGAFGFDLSFQEEPHPLAVPFTNVRADDWIKRYPPAIWGRTAFLEAEPDEAQPPTTQPGGDGSAERAPAGRVVLRFRDKRPAIVASEFGEGRTVWVGTSIDNGWLARAGALFLPVFLEEAALYLTRSSSSVRNLRVGDVLSARLPREATKIRVVPPGGGALSPTLITPEGTQAANAQYEYQGVSRSGIWQLTYQMPAGTGETEDASRLYAVNPDPKEGALLPAKESDVRDGIPSELDLAFLPSFGEVTEELEEAREGEITRYLLWALLALLLLESFLALKFGRRSMRKEEAPSAAPDQRMDA